MMGLDLVIRGGTLVSASETVQVDLGVREGQIAVLGHHMDGETVIDATGLLVLPGAVDPHVHLEMPAGETTSSDTWATGTQAAVCGGTTTVIDFVEPDPGESLLAALEKRCAQADGQSIIDYSLHMTLTDPSTLDQIPDVVAAGVPSFKTYTTYEGFRLTDSEFLATLNAVRDCDGLVLVHAENDAIIQDRTAALLAGGDWGPSAHPLSRPPAAEAEAITRALAMAEISNARLYVVHVSTARGAEAIAQARKRGQEAWGETCPQYLLLTDEEYHRPGFEGAKFVCSPPLRSAADQAALWSALAAGDLQSVGTDHCPFFYAGQKDLGRDRFTHIPGGLPGIQARLALLYTYGVRAGKLDHNRWVDVCSTTPARIFNLYPRKGALVPGSDADIVLFDPKQKVTLSAEFLSENVDYTPYEGFTLEGYPVKTYVGGKLVAEDGKIVGGQPRGSFLRRSMK
jgi:dihydropyrimidinase